jgi:murein DD-endopeptidase MepM/ murein hydrolase activator NlpD
MASPLAQLISTSTSGYGGGYSPFAQVGQGAQGSSYTGQSAYNGPAGSIQEQAGAWNPYAQSNSNRINAWMAKQQAEAQAKLNQVQSPLTNNGGQVSSLGGDWAGVDRWNNEIGAAAGKYGVPANLMKALMKLESGGANLGRNGAGAIGPMQVVDTYWGDLGYDLYDPAQNIMAGAAVLKQNYDQYAGWAQQNGIDPWQAAIYSYYAGNPYNMNAADDPSQGGSGMSTADYGARIWADYQALNSAGGTSTGNYNSPTGMSSNAWNAITGGTEYPISQEMGLNDFSAQHLNGMYAYGTAYGITGHAGIDEATPAGTGLYSPVSGTVKVSGGSGYYCYYDSCGPGVGELMLELDNGDQLILGHMQSIGVQVGQRVNPGQYVGVSGGAGTGDHVHVEYRKLGGNTSSGYTAVDPRQALGGGSISLTGGGTGTTGGATYGKRNYLTDFMSHFS